MKINSIVSSCLLLLTTAVFADTVTVHNKTEYTLWVSLYQQENLSYHRMHIPQPVMKNSLVTLDRSAQKKCTSCFIVLHYEDSLLLPVMNNEEWKKAIHKHCNSFYEKTFYIERVDGILTIYNVFEWNIVSPFVSVFNYVTDFIMGNISNSADNMLAAIENNPYAQHGAFVREGNQLHPGERLYMQRRKQKISKALESIIQKDIADTAIPSISCAFSGGGLRASLATLGFLSGLEKTGLLDAMMFGSFISGSSWSYAGWCAKGGTLSDYKKEFFKVISNGIAPREEDIQAMVKALLVKVIEGQPITLVDIFGLLLGNAFFGYYMSDPHQCYISQSLKRVRNGEWMMPIYTAIDAQEDEHSRWYECTPYEFGSAWLAKYIPVWAFGRKFVDGQSIDYAPEQTIGYMLGLFGSAFAAQLEQIYQTFQTSIYSPKIKALIQELLKPVSHERLTYAEVHNFSVGMYKEVIPQIRLLRMADAGSKPGFNFPYPPLSQERSERKSDIIIFFNMALEEFPGESLLAAQQYAYDRNFKFPPIDTSEIDQRPFSIFKDNDDPTVPVIIYLPLINDPSLWPLLDFPEYASYKPLIYNFDIKNCIASGACTIFESRYDAYLSEQIAALAEFNLCVHKERIYDEIKSMIAYSNKG